MSTTLAKALNGHEVNGFQPINGEKGSVETFLAAFWTSSVVYDTTSGKTSTVTFWESSQVYTPLAYDATSSIGETICVPDPITQQDCSRSC